MSQKNRRPRFTSDELLSDLRAALEGAGVPTDSEYARLDYRRSKRIGTPEIIYAESKSPAQVLELAERMMNRTGRVLASRVSGPVADDLKRRFSSANVEHPERSSMVRITASNPHTQDLFGKAAVFTAGTSDLPIAHEVRMVMEEMGVECTVSADMGVAGLHRLVQPFREAMDWGASVIVVVAGMDGALPSVIAGLSPVPVIGLPVSVGYGYGGDGSGALMTMLQSCAPGLTVVNIDNSVGAGVAAARIALQSAQAE
jgi:pyridinium-3,5-biscarboxylic acid mononucleotide synthase